MTDFDDILNEAIQRRTANPNSEDVDVLIGETVVDLRFFEMDSLDWGNATAVNPARFGSPVDTHYGFNLHGAARSVAPTSGVRIVDGEPVKLTEETWAKIFAALSGHDLGRLSDAVWKLNEWLPSQRLDAAKKARSAAAAKSANSPSS